MQNFHYILSLIFSFVVGVVAWAVSAEVVMGVQREAALKNQVSLIKKPSKNKLKKNHNEIRATKVTNQAQFGRRFVFYR